MLRHMRVSIPFPSDQWIVHFLNPRVFLSCPAPVSCPDPAPPKTSRDFSFCHHRLALPPLRLPRDGIIHYVLFPLRLSKCSIVFGKSIHIVAHSRKLFFFSFNGMLVFHCMSISQLIHSSLKMIMQFPVLGSYK